MRGRPLPAVISPGVTTVLHWMGTRDGYAGWVRVGFARRALAPRLRTTIRQCIRRPASRQRRMLPRQGLSNIASPGPPFPHSKCSTSRANIAADIRWPRHWRGVKIFFADEAHFQADAELRDRPSSASSTCWCKVALDRVVQANHKTNPQEDSHDSAGGLCEQIRDG